MASRVAPAPVDTSAAQYEPQPRARQMTFAHQRTPRRASGATFAVTPRSAKQQGLPTTALTPRGGNVAAPKRTFFGPGGPVHRFYDKPSTQGFLFALLFLALFMLDIFKAALAADTHNDGLYGTLCAILVIFFLEILVCSAAKPAYVGGFFFWCDVVGTVSLIFDIPWLVPGVDSEGSMLRASRTTRVGARAARVTKMIRVLRVVRVVRVVKLLKYFNAFGAKNNKDDEEKLPPATRVSNALSEAISKRVAMLVMFLVLVVPLLQYDALKAVPQRAHLDAFERQLEGGKVLLQSEVQDFFSFYTEADARPWKLQYGGSVAYCPQGRRHSGAEAVTFVSAAAVAALGGDADTALASPAAIFPNRDNNVQLLGNCRSGSTCVKVDINTEPRVIASAVLNIILISAVIVCLLGFTMTLQNKVSLIVVRPLERIFVALNDGMSELLNAVKRQHGTHNDSTDGDNVDGAEDNTTTEMDVLATAVAKLSRLGASVTTHATGHGSAAAKVMLSDDNIDDGTKKWLVGAYTQAGGRHKELDASITARRMSLAGASGAGSGASGANAGGGQGEGDNAANDESSSLAVQKSQKSRRPSKSFGIAAGTGGPLLTPGAGGASLQRMLKGCLSFEFDVLECDPAHLAPVSLHLFEAAGVTKDFDIEAATLRTFVDTVLEAYRDNPYVRSLASPGEK